jgi:chromosome segregation ATPase
MPNMKITKRSLTSDMDQSIKRMLKLIEEDGDSFAKKAEMYYQKRPELVSHVEKFYRMYRSLAERYDHVTGELRKNVPSELQSPRSGISDPGLELPSTPDHRLGHRKSGHRAAGFDVFLGSGGNSSDVSQIEGDESSTLTDSESESDDSSVNNYSVLLGNGGDIGLNRKMIDLEIELREVKEKLRMQQEENSDGSLRGSKNELPEDLLAIIARYEQELRIANDKIRLSEDAITRLKIEIQRYKSLDFGNDFQYELGSSTQEDVKTREVELDLEINQALEVQERVGESESEVLDWDGKIKALVEELRMNKEKLQDSENEIACLKHELENNSKSSENASRSQAQLELAHKEIATWKTKLNTEKREVSKLQERIARLKASLSDRDHEVRDLKIEVSDAEQKIFPEKAQLKSEMSKLLEERTRLEEQLREWECRARLLEEEIRKVKAEKTYIEERLTGEIEHLKADIVDRGDRIENLNKSLDALKVDRDELNAKVLTLTAEVSHRDDRIDQMDKHLQQFHVEQAELITEMEGSRKFVGELRSRAKELEEEVERQRVVIFEGAEEKREAIRQLCFSLEHYRNGYHMLRQAFIGHKRVPVLAS